MDPETPSLKRLPRISEDAEGELRVAYGKRLVLVLQVATVVISLVIALGLWTLLIFVLLPLIKTK